MTSKDKTEVLPVVGMEPRITLSQFTEEEVEKAREEAKAIKRDLAMASRMTFRSVGRIYEFRENMGPEKLGFNGEIPWHDFIKSIGYSPSTYYKYFGIYETLTLKLGVSLKEYEHLDLGKVYSLKILADQAEQSKLEADQKRDVIVKFIENVEQLTGKDLQNSVNEKIDEIRILGGEIEQKPEKNTPKEPLLNYLRPGTYKLMPLHTVDANIDPKRNRSNLEKLPRVNATWYYSKEAGEIVLEIY
ncbi:MAG: hypothetical protein WCY30_01670 [Candidatus Neomarinimicrobiota bacterium]|jgi:hypothetical protein